MPVSCFLNEPTIQAERQKERKKRLVLSSTSLAGRCNHINFVRLAAARAGDGVVK